MKTCVVRRRFYSTEADNATVDVDLEPNFGVPKAVMIFFVESSATTDNFDTTLEYRSMGVGMVGPSPVTQGYQTVSYTLRDNQDDSDSRRDHSPSLFEVTNTAGTLFYRSVAATLLDSKVRVTFTDQTPQTNGHLECLVFAISGDDVSAGVGFTIISTSTSANTTSTYGGLSFQPDLLMFASTNTASSVGLNGDAIFGFGASTRSPFKERCVSFFYDDAIDDNVQATRTATDCVLGFHTAAGTFRTTNIDSYNATGWTTRNRGAMDAANRGYIWMALKFQNPSDVALVDIETQTSTGLFYTGLGSTGFIPQTIIGGATAADVRNTNEAASPEADAMYLFGGMGQSYSKHYLGDGTATFSTGSATVTGSGSTFFKYAPGFKLFTLSGLEIGTVSTVSSNISLTLTANALQTGTGVGYCYGTHMQGCLILGDDDANEASNNNTKVYSKCSSYFNNLTLSTTPTDLHQSYLMNFDSRPGFEVNTVLASASNRYGWAVAFKSADANRRRGRIT